MEFITSWWGPKPATFSFFIIVGDNPRVDLLFRAGPLKFEEAVKDRFEAEVEGVKIPFVGLESLIQSKRTNRAKDKADLEVLEQLRKTKK